MSTPTINGGKKYLSSSNNYLSHVINLIRFLLRNADKFFKNIPKGPK